MTSDHMKHPVYLDFLQANQIVAALQAREVRLSTTASPDDRVTARAVADCIAAEYAIRAAFRFPRESDLDAAHEASVAEMRELADGELPDVPLAGWAPGELVEAWGK